MLHLQLISDNKQKLVVLNQKTDDIIDLMMKGYNDSKKYFPVLKKYFVSNGDTCQDIIIKIWKYAMNRFIYYKEPASKQVVRTVARVVQDRYVDCKGYAQFFACACAACGLKVAFKFTSYKDYDKTPTHVYTIVECKGKKIILDGVTKKINYEAPFYYYRLNKLN